MKTYKYKDREEYLGTQIVRSQQKSSYCKVYFSDAIRYHRLLKMDIAERNLSKGNKLSPILCLGVRSGAELDIFRSVFFGPLFRLDLVKRLAIQNDRSTVGKQKTRLARTLGHGSGRPDDGRVVGVELSALTPRSDVHIGSFDELPTDWTDRFRIIYSNSFDHAQDPYRTMAEWKRVAAPDAYVIIGFSYFENVSVHDPLGGLTFEKLRDLWQLPTVFFSETYNQNGYAEVCFRLDTK